MQSQADKGVSILAYTRPSCIAGHRWGNEAVAFIERLASQGELAAGSLVLALVFSQSTVASTVDPRSITTNFNDIHGNFGMH